MNEKGDILDTKIKDV